jgi:hypothetical protein
MDTTYNTLHSIVSPVLKHYRDDLEKHDKKAIENHSDTFLYGYRESGTNIIMLSNDITYYFKKTWLTEMINAGFKNDKILETIHQSLKEHVGFVTYLNQIYLYFDGKQFKGINKEKVNSIWTAHIDKLIAGLKEKNPNPNQIFTF